MGEHTTADVLAELALFSSLDDATLALLAERLKVQVAEDEKLFEEGDAGRCMYVVLDGKVTLSKRSKTGQRKSVATAAAGDWFGEMSLLDVMARPVRAQADAGTRLLTLCPTDLSAVYRANVKMYALLVMNMARQLSRKLRTAELSLACALCGEDAKDV